MALPHPRWWALQVVKGKGTDGCVPLAKAGPSRRPNQSQPPLAAAVLLEIVRRSTPADGGKPGMLPLADLLFDDLLDVSDWFERERTLPPLGISCLGGSSVRMARDESGLDNSPMCADHPSSARTRPLLAHQSRTPTPAPCPAPSLGPAAAPCWSHSRQYRARPRSHSGHPTIGWLRRCSAGFLRSPHAPR